MWASCSAGANTWLTGRKNGSRKCPAVPESEIRELRARIAELMNEAANNERLLKRNQEREFEILLPDATIDHARGLAERIREAVVATPLEMSAGVERTLSVAIGMAAVGPAKVDSALKGVAERLFSAADAALYRAQQAGRNRVEVESP